MSSIDIYRLTAHQVSWPNPPRTWGLATRTIATFTLMRREARNRNEVGLYLVDDASGRIGELLPGDHGYAESALGRRLVLFNHGQNTGATTQLVLPGGSFFGTYLIANSTAE